MYHEYREKHAQTVAAYRWPGPEDPEHDEREAWYWNEVRLLLLEHIGRWLKLRQGNQAKLEARLRLKVGEDWYKSEHVADVCRLLEGIPR